jgi:hypothetical protein
MASWEERTMAYTVACWNIEKSGQSSDPTKQANVSEFIQFCSNHNIDVVFLCEVHSARVDDYVEFLKRVYGTKYSINSLPGGYSNAYVLMVRLGVNLVLSQDTLKGLNRGVLVLHEDQRFMLCLAHFKSGQTGLTRDQLQQAAVFLDNAQPWSWAITGDMNWHYGNAGGLTVPGGTHSHTCWPDMTQASGNILDWCMAGGIVAVEPWNLGGTRLPPSMTDMSGPDHRPVVFTLTLA